MLPEISRRQFTQAAAWSAPVIAASSLVPAYAASKAYTFESGLFVTARTMSSTESGYGTSGSVQVPATPAGYWKSNPKPEMDLSWNDATSTATDAVYHANGEGVFPPSSTGTTDGYYNSISGFWFSAPVATASKETGSGYVGTTTMAAGAVFETVVTLVVPSNVTPALTISDGSVLKNTAWTKALGPVNLNSSSTGKRATYLGSVSRAAGTLTASAPTITTDSAGNKVFTGVLTYTTTQAVATKGYYAMTQIMPAKVNFNPGLGWTSFTLSSRVVSASLSFSGTAEAMDSVVVTGQPQTTTIKK